MKLDTAFDGFTKLKNWWKTVKGNFETIQDEHNAEVTARAEHAAVIGNESVSGHVRLSDAIGSTYRASDGRAATPYAVYTARLKAQDIAADYDATLKTELEGEITAEATAREAADSAEVTAREAAVAAEAEAREAADTALQSSLANETAQREARESDFVTLLNGKAGTEVGTSLTTTVSTLYDSLGAELYGIGNIGVVTGDEGNEYYILSEITTISGPKTSHRLTWERLATETELENKVDKTQYASTEQAGIVQLYGVNGSNRSGLSVSDGGVIVVNTNSDYGTARTGDGKVTTAAASEADIDAQSNGYKPITPKTLSYAVQAVGGELSGLTTEDKTSYTAAINEVRARIDGAGSSGGGTAEVDTALSETSENPVQNKIVTASVGAVMSCLESVTGDIQAGKSFAFMGADDNLLSAAACRFVTGDETFEEYSIYCYMTQNMPQGAVLGVLYGENCFDFVEDSSGDFQQVITQWFKNSVTGEKYARSIAVTATDTGFEYASDPSEWDELYPWEVI